MLYWLCEFLYFVYVEFTLSDYRGAGELFSNVNKRLHNVKPD